jgi:hypothetical protein
MRRRLGQATPVAGIVVAVTAIVLVASVFQGLSSNRGGLTPLRHHRAVALTRAVDLDLGQVSSRAMVRTCLGGGFASSPSQVDVLYGVMQRQSSGEGPVFVLRNRSGALRLCDHWGADRPSQSPLPTLSQRQPVAYLSNGRSSWDCVADSRVLRRLSMTAWLIVSPDVAAVQQRYFINGHPGRWFTTRPQSGFVHLQSWLTGPKPAEASYVEQYRVLGFHGDVIAQRVLPASQPLPGCASGSGSAIN